MITLIITALHLLIDLYTIIISKFYTFSSECFNIPLYEIKVHQDREENGKRRSIEIIKHERKSTDSLSPPKKSLEIVNE